MASLITSYTMIVRNKMMRDRHFFIFTEPAEFDMDGENKTVYNNAVGSGHLAAKTAFNEDELHIELDIQFMAGAQLQTRPPRVGVVQTGKISAVKVGLRPNTNRATEMKLDPDARPNLTDPVVDNDAPDGTFKISTSTFGSGLGPFNVGTAVKCDGRVQMASYIEGYPSEDIYVKPVQMFYVATGRHIAGANVNYAVQSRGAAKVEAKNGNTKFVVTLEDNGTWTVDTL